MTTTPKKQIDWEEFIESSTLSSSGWRRIFNSKNDPKSLDKYLNSQLTNFIIIATEVIADHYKKNKTTPTIALGRDSRPTGNAITEIMLQTLSNHGVSVLNLGITALPQCSSVVKANNKLDGFVFVTASHNPPGYNGIKIGNRRGAIISSAVNHKLVAQLKLRLLASNKTKIKTPRRPPLVTSVVDEISITEPYRQSLLKSMGYQQEEVHHRFQKMLAKISSRNGSAYPTYAIGCDFNGSARIQAIDKSFITELGIKFLSYNNQLGKFAHDIVPEQKSLETLRVKMSNMPWEKYRLLFGYAVDCDGDRGNLVVNRQQNKKKIPIAPDAQTTFALTTLTELCYLKAFSPNQLSDTVIVANGPTSLRVDTMAYKFGAEVVRAEVGEANIIDLSRIIRRQGRLTPIMGEGSNGGSIIYPAVVRDPLSMVASLIKFLFLDNGKISLRDIAVEQLGLPKALKKIPSEFFLSELIPHINTHYSTSVFDPTALIRTPYSTQKQFKLIYEKLWKKNWSNKKPTFHSWGVSNYRILNYEGSKTHEGAGNRNGKHDGGHKISFFNQGGNEVGFIWFRFSKTEPVLRLSAEHHDPTVQKEIFSFLYNLLLQTSQEDNA